MKTYYTVTLTAYSPYCKAFEQFSKSFVHARNNLTDTGIMRILRRDHGVNVDANICTVGKMVYQSH